VFGVGHQARRVPSTVQWCRAGGSNVKDRLFLCSRWCRQSNAIDQRPTFSKFVKFVHIIFAVLDRLWAFLASFVRDGRSASNTYRFIRSTPRRSMGRVQPLSVVTVKNERRYYRHREEISSESGSDHTRSSGALRSYAPFEIRIQLPFEHSSQQTRRDTDRHRSRSRRIRT